MKAAWRPALPKPWTETTASSILRQPGDRPQRQQVLGDEHRALGGGGAAPGDAPEVDRLAGDHAEVLGVGVQHGVGVVDPRHGVGVGVHVGRRDVGVGPDGVAQGGDEAPGDAALLVHRQLGGVALHPALGPAEGDVRDGALPGHPRGQGLDLVLVHRGVEADAALARAASGVVQHPVAAEDVHLAVVHDDGQGDLDDALRLEEPLRYALPALEVLHVGDGLLELVAGDVVGVEVLGDRGRLGHIPPSSDATGSLLSAVTPRGDHRGIPAGGEAPGSMAGTALRPASAEDPGSGIVLPWLRCGAGVPALDGVVGPPGRAPSPGRSRRYPAGRPGRGPMERDAPA